MILDRMSLTGKAAVVTGASRGLGKAMALGLAEAGADVVLVSRRMAQLRAVAQEISQLSRIALPISADISNLRDVNDMVEMVLGEFGRIDILVNNAGTTVRMPSESFTEEAWDEVMDVNLKGAFFCAQAVGKAMIDQRAGKIINIASLLSVIGVPTAVAYAASKGGISQLTKTLAVEWAKYNINVNAIGPGYFRTDLTRPLQEDRDRSAQILSRIPMRRWGDPDDLKGVVVFLASEASDYITGQTIYVDGGWLAA
jgi:2-deoxy-D-gluconate 3-dehydrogenase